MLVVLYKSLQIGSARKITFTSSEMEKISIIAFHENLAKITKKTFYRHLNEVAFQNFICMRNECARGRKVRHQAKGSLPCWCPGDGNKSGHSRKPGRNKHKTKKMFMP